VYGEGERIVGRRTGVSRHRAGVEPVRAPRVTVSRQTLHELEAAHRDLITMHLEKDLKSVRVLREMRR